MSEIKKRSEFLSYFRTVDGNEGSKCKYPTRLDMYGRGCSHDCSYCYAKSLLEFRKLWDPQNPAVADINKIRRVINKKLQPGDTVRLGGMTDCFQAIELEERTTYQTIKALNERGVHYLIVTKSDIVARDEYIEIMDKNLAHIQITVTSTDDAIGKTYEKAISMSRRIQAIEKLYEAGFDITLRLSPMIPQYVDFDRLAKIKCDKILVEFLRVNTWIKKWFDLDYSDYTLKQSGYQHLPLEKKKEYLSLIKGFKEVSVCEDYGEHYEYWKDNFNPNKYDCCNLRNSPAEKKQKEYESSAIDCREEQKEEQTKAD